MKKRSAVFPLSGDPPTRGHLDIVRRSAALFETLRVVIFENAQKTPLLSAEERLDLLKACLKDVKNLIFDKNAGLLSDYCARNGVSVVVRSLRNCGDFDYERDLEYGIKGLEPSLEFLYLSAKPSLANVSSTMAKNLYHQNAFTHDYLPLNVKERLEEKQGRFIVGYTGSIAVGKSTLGLRLEETLKKLGFEAHYLDLDRVVHSIYSFKDHPNLKNQFNEAFGPDVFAKDGGLDRKALLSVLLKEGNEAKWRLVSQMLRPAVVGEIQNYLKTRRGFFFLDGTVLIENKMLPLVNNNLILVGCEEKLQLKRLMERDGLDEKLALKKIEKAGSSKKKKELYLAREDAPYGRLFEIESKEHTPQEDVEKLAKDLVEHFIEKKTPKP